MKQLYPAQQRAYDFFLPRLQRGWSTLDTSDVGTGKTVVATKLAHQLSREGHPIMVVCPKSVVPMWERELREESVEPIGVINYEKLRGGRTRWLSKKFKRVMRWEIPENSIVLFDEVHACKGVATQNAQLLIAATQQHLAAHCMSATAAEDPTEMRALGYALGLHNLNEHTPQLPGWTNWMRRHGCYQDPWKNWCPGLRKHLEPLHAALHEGPNARVHKLRVSDFPDSFRQNLVFVEPLDFGDNQEIHAIYEEHGITPSIIEDLLEHGTVAGNSCVLVDLLRARQLAEAYKLPTFATMVRELIEQHHSVTVFVNFRESIEFLGESLKDLAPLCIQGGQSPEDRQHAIDSFQSDHTRVLLINVAAGGTGVSLHDLQGRHQRVSLISPSFNAKQHLQTLGRIHRNGALTDAIQKVLVAANTIEEHVMRSIENKLQNLQTIFS